MKPAAAGFFVPRVLVALPCAFLDAGQGRGKKLDRLLAGQRQLR